jgi:hypothetical protein
MAQRLWAGEETEKWVREFSTTQKYSEPVQLLEPTALEMDLHGSVEERWLLDLRQRYELAAKLLALVDNKAPKLLLKI